MAPKVKKKKSVEWKKLGEVGIDTATLLITDPASIYNPRIFPSSYDEWLDEMLFPMLEADVSQINYPLGHPGAGVAVDLGGDGTMEVFAKMKDGIVVEIKIK